MKTFHITWYIQYYPPLLTGEDYTAPTMLDALNQFHKEHDIQPFNIVDKTKYFNNRNDVMSSTPRRYYSTEDEMLLPNYDNCTLTGDELEMLTEKS